MPVTYDVSALLLFVWLTLASACLSLTITKGRPLAFLRVWVHGWNQFLGELISCPYCMSHWICGIACAIFMPCIVVTGNPFCDWALATLAMVTVTSWCGGLIYRAYA